MIGARASGVAIIVAVATAFGLYSGRRPQETFHSHLIAEAAAQTPADPETLGSPAASGPKASEPNLAPLTLTPQRMQSIGVKIGVVERRKVGKPPLAGKVIRDMRVDRARADKSTALRVSGALHPARRAERSRSNSRCTST